MEKDNFLYGIGNIAGISSEKLKAELRQVQAPDGFAASVLTKTVIGNAGTAEPSGMAAPDGDAPESLITPSEFEQGVFMKIMIKSLPEPSAPPDFAEQVMKRIGQAESPAQPPAQPAANYGRKIAAALTIAAVVIGGVLVNMSSNHEAPTAPLKQTQEMNSPQPTANPAEPSEIAPATNNNGTGILNKPTVIVPRNAKKTNIIPNDSQQAPIRGKDNGLKPGIPEDD